LDHHGDHHDIHSFPTRRSSDLGGRDSMATSLTGRLSRGLQAPICLTWELTYGCNLACVHCLSSSGRRDPAELSPAEARRVVDERSEEHTSELQSPYDLVCRLLL